MTRFDSLNNRIEVFGIFSDSTWEGQLGTAGPTLESQDDRNTIVPLGNLVLPLNDDWFFGFTMLGSGFSEDYGDDWPGRYLLQEFELLYVSAFPSLAYRINKQWSVAASAAGLLDASIDVDTRSPQSMTAGLYHEFADAGAVTFDVVWIDFSRFKLSEIYVNGDQINDGGIGYDDIWVFSVGYTKPVSARLSLGIGAMYVDDMVSDDKRTMTLRLDDMWMLGVGAEWQWNETRSLFATLNYLQIGDAPVRTDSIGGIGSTMGRYKDRGSILLQIGMKLGAGPR